MARLAGQTLAGEPRLLVVRRDNIGDLVCTTPLISALRRRFADAWIGALVNSYNAPVLEGNPDIDAVFAYEKLKHRQGGLASNLWDRYRLVSSLRKRKLDFILLAGESRRSLAMARAVAAKTIVGFGPPGSGLDIALSRGAGEHEVEITFELARALGVAGSPPPLCVMPQAEAVDRLRAEAARKGLEGKPLVGLHISARKQSQRLPLEFVRRLIEHLARDKSLGFVLFWAPGSERDPRHPGDDERALELVRALRQLPLLPVPTRALGDLIAGLALCRAVVCSDGGAMHLAAALGKPVLCFFGRSDLSRWHPWAVPYEALQPESRNVSDLSVADALGAYRRLAAKAPLS